MPSTWGQSIKVSIFGESHGEAVGCVIDNLPPGEDVDLESIKKQNRRRRPGQAAWATPRDEKDEAQILSGVYNGKTSGTPLAAIIWNHDQHSKDYTILKNKPRPGHADLTSLMRYNGANDPRGSGHFSGRITAPLVTAGTICKDILASRGIKIAAHALEIGGVQDDSAEVVTGEDIDLLAVADKTFPTMNDAAGEAMQAAILTAKEDKDSVGGIIEVVCYGYPGGIGSPFFGGIEPQLATWFYAVPAVKGVSFGAGFDVAKKRGSQNNDNAEIRTINGKKSIRLQSNHAGGADGGISNGMPIVAQLAFKPPASIGAVQDTVDLESMENTTLEVPGRHDPCIVPRAVPVVESVMAMGLLDLLLSSGLFYSLPRVKTEKLEKQTETVETEAVVDSEKFED